MKVQRWNRRIALIFIYPNVICGWVVNVTAPRFALGNDALNTVYDAGCDPRPEWKNAKNLILTGILHTDHFRELMYKKPQITQYTV